MRRVGRVITAALLLAGSGAPLAAQEATAADHYFRAVSEFFEIPAGEVAILRQWRLDAEEVPVVLFVAGRTGVSAEALAQLRRSGQGWGDLASRYGLDASHFHVPLPEEADAHALSGPYGQYRTLPPARWREVRLTDADIVVLVNVRLLAQTLRLPTEQVLRRHAGTPSFVELYTALLPAGAR